MNRLHEVIYKIVSHPQILADFDQQPQKTIDQFNLSHNEILAIKSTLVDSPTWSQLLSTETLKQATNAIIEDINVWIPSIGE